MGYRTAWEKGTADGCKTLTPIRRISRPDAHHPSSRGENLCAGAGSQSLSRPSEPKAITTLARAAVRSRISFLPQRTVIDWKCADRLVRPPRVSPGRSGGLMSHARHHVAVAKRHRRDCSGGVDVLTNQDHPLVRTVHLFKTALLPYLTH